MLKFNGLRDLVIRGFGENNISYVIVLSCDVKESVKATKIIDMMKKKWKDNINSILQKSKNNFLLMKDYLNLFLKKFMWKWNHMHWCWKKMKRCWLLLKFGIIYFISQVQMIYDFKLLKVLINVVILSFPSNNLICFSTSTFIAVQNVLTETIIDAKDYQRNSYISLFVSKFRMFTNINISNGSNLTYK